MNKNILVIGSSNTDLVIQTSHFPEPGETVIGGEFNTFAGGKGANQAVAACRLGGNVTFVAKLGKDGFGQEALKGFKKEGIITTHIYMDASLPSGVASIILNEKGQNTIVVAPGANNALTEADIELTKDAMSEADIVLIQLEVPLTTVIFAIKQAYHLGKRVILNPAPATRLPDEIYPFIDLITPNETEAGILLGMKVIDENTAALAAGNLLKRGVKNVILTLGEKGAFLKNDEIELLVPAVKTKVRDTTGAGDIFNGALAVSLSEKKGWLEAIQFANRAASIGVSRLGAQASVPYRNEVDRIT